MKKIIKILEEPKNNLVIFKIHGFSLSNQKYEDELIFGDATVINRKDLITIINECNFEKYDKLIFKDIEENTKAIIEDICNITTNDSDTFIAVLVFNELDYNNIFEYAKKRADEIIALLFYIFLNNSSFEYGVCLADQLHATIPNEILKININKTTYKVDYTKGEKNISVPEKPINYTFDGLTSLLNNKIYKELYKLIKCRTDNQIKTVIAVFYSAINIPNPASQLSGCFTILDLLLKPTQGKSGFAYSKINFIVDVYVLSKLNRNHEEIDISKLYNVRNKFIHEGKIINKNDVNKIIILITQLIIIFSKLFSEYRSLEKINKILDLIMIINTLSIDEDNNFEINDVFLKKILELRKDFTIKINNYDKLNLSVIYLIRYYGINSHIKQDNFYNQLIEAINHYTRIESCDEIYAFNQFKQHLTLYKTVDLPDNYNDFNNLVYGHIEDKLEDYINDGDFEKIEDYLN